MMSESPSQSLIQLEYYLKRYQEKKGQNKKLYVINRMTVLTLGASIPVLTTIEAASWITALVGAAIVIVTGIGQILGPHERYIAFRMAYKLLDREKMLFLGRVGEYGTEEKADAALATKMADIISSTEADVISAAKKGDIGGGAAPT